MSRVPRHQTVAEVLARGVYVASPTTPLRLPVRLIEETRKEAAKW